MTPSEIIDIAKSGKVYNLHSHTQFCDGRADMATMAVAAADASVDIYGFSPHSPLPIESPCNMTRGSVADYLAEADRLKGVYDGEMEILTGMEVDFLGHDFGTHLDYFQELPLDYRIGSVHFVPNQDGIHIDCDGRFERFSQYLHDGFRSDLRYVVETYFCQVLRMIEEGGFEILGHLDKIAGNAAQADPEIEEQSWYEALVDDIIREAAYRGLAVEINTKAFEEKGRFFPAQRWWPKLREAGIVPVISTDAHYPDRILSGYAECGNRILNFKF